MTESETGSALLRDVIDIPEHAGAEDYVLRLTDGVGHDRVAATIHQPRCIPFRLLRFR